MLYTMGVLCLCSAVYFLVFVPLQTYRQATQTSLNTAREVFNEVSFAARVIEERATISPHSEKGQNGEPVRVLASATAQQLGLGITRIQPLTETDVAFWFDMVEVRDLFRWIVALEADARVSVPRVEVVKLPDADAVQAQVVLRSGR
jgi:type II secretory pathway component PulM